MKDDIRRNDGESTPKFVNRMMNRARAINKSKKGSILERDIIHKLVAQGFSCIKGAGSKSYGQGKIDIVAINPIKKQIWLIQAKNHKRNGLSVGEKERSQLWEIFNSNFEKKSYTMNCELITNIKDLEAVILNHGL